ncbi:DgyrCDS7505 [Dimorphilus gyrociliatus]|uniref:Centrosomal protein of 70 kDa n=1 Tax=Dimorphilus gyrociliatus TaxID=2664684 RepID=A0A7I8VR73_9ANNE|nr:DgyrCDS7505 [Dimorphilus gyrociliatus]
MAGFAPEILVEQDEWHRLNDDLKHHGLLPLDIRLSDSGEIFLGSRESSRLRHILITLLSDTDRRQKLVHELLVTNQQLRTDIPERDNVLVAYKRKIEQLEEQLDNHEGLRKDTVKLKTLEDAIETAERRVKRARGKANELQQELNDIYSKLDVNTSDEANCALDALLKLATEIRSEFDDEPRKKHTVWCNKTVHRLTSRISQMQADYQLHKSALDSVCCRYLPKIKPDSSKQALHVIKLIEEEGRKHKRSLNDIPENVTRQVILHFMEVFNIRDFGGIYTAINSLYTKTSEYTNVLNALARTLGLDEDISPFQIVDSVADLVDIANDAAAKRVCDALGVTDIEDATAKIREQQAFLPTFRNIIKQLISILRLQTMEEIVPAVRALKLLAS